MIAMTNEADLVVHNHFLPRAVPVDDYVILATRRAAGRSCPCPGIQV